MTARTAWTPLHRQFSNAPGSSRARTRAGVVGGNAVGQVEETGEPRPPVEADFRAGGERVGSGEDTADGVEADVDQGVLAGPLAARVVEVVEVVVERGGRAVGHGNDPSEAGDVISAGRLVGRGRAPPSPRRLAILMRRP